MSSTDTALATVVTGVMRELIAHADAAYRPTLENQARILDQLQVASEEFSAISFLQAEAQHALGD